jgi:hypothetical protein
MHYDHTAIPDGEVPRAALPFAQHMLDTYASEASKVASVWAAFADADAAGRQ